MLIHADQKKINLRFLRAFFISIAIISQQVFVGQGDNMKRWHGSCIGALLVLLIGGGSLFFFVPVGGAMIAAMPPLFDRLTAYVLCPDAADYSYRDFGSAPIDSTNPSGGTGHFTELTCTYADGSQKVFGNNEVGLKGLAASFTLAGICGGVVVLFFMIIAAIIGARLVKPKATP